MNQAPGLSARNLIVADPPGGTVTVSLRIGFGWDSFNGGLMLGSSDVMSWDLWITWNLLLCERLRQWVQLDCGKVGGWGYLLAVQMD